MSTSLDEMFDPKAPQGQPPVEYSAGLGPAPEADPDGFDDLELEPLSRRRIHPVTGALLLALFGIGAFAGGVAVQKEHGSSAAAGLPSGLSRAGAGGFGEFPGGLPGAQGAPTGAGTSAAASTASAAVIGQVVSVDGTTLTVKNFGGKTVIVHLPAGATVTRTTSAPVTSLTAGMTVSVDGATASDGSVTATAVTTRGTG